VANRNTRVSRAVGMMAVVGLAVTACGAQPGAAAVINGEGLSEDYLAAAVADYNELLGQQIEPKDMLATLIVIPTLVDTGAEHGIGVSRSQAADLLAAQAELTGQEAPQDGYSEGMLDIAQLQLVNREISQSPAGTQIMEEFWQAIEAADIDVNPRYGSFEFEENTGPQIVSPPLPWLADTGQ